MRSAAGAARRGRSAVIDHLFDTHGFPTAANYGESWEPWLIAVFVICKMLTLVGYIELLAGFVKSLQAIAEGRIDAEAAAVHLPRVIRFFIVSVTADIALILVQIAAFWWPAYRFIALVTAVQALCLQAAALKTAKAYVYCVRPRGAVS